MKDPDASQPDHWRRRCFFVIAAWLIFTFMLSFSTIRGVVAYPLFVHNDDASGDAAYVMADGHAYWERLRAASDLYHMKRVPRIIISDERWSSSYNFTKRQSETRVERAIDYLALRGVPRDTITKVDYDESAAFGSLSEARAVANVEQDLKRIVVVTSAPHTRRSELCFRRSFPKDVRVDVYSASPPSEGAEITAPIWIEYAKLVVYFFVA